MYGIKLTIPGIECMRLLIAILLPWLAFFTINRPIAGVVCLVLQITLIGWIPAAIWAAYAVSQYHTDQKIQRAVRPGRRPF
jgi:uncharacterized membrane protein YqaE (UPF0057 family)